LVSWEYHHITAMVQEFGLNVLNWNLTPLTSDVNSKSYNMFWIITWNSKGKPQIATTTPWAVSSSGAVSIAKVLLGGELMKGYVGNQLKNQKTSQAVLAGDSI